jgi:hypothetical protein
MGVRGVMASMVLLDFVGTIFSMLGLQLCGSGLHTVVMSGAVCWSAVLSFFMLKKKVSAAEFGSLVIIVTGLVFSALAQTEGSPSTDVAAAVAVAQKAPDLAQFLAPRNSTGGAPPDPVAAAELHAEEEYHPPSFIAGAKAMNKVRRGAFGGGSFGGAKRMRAAPFRGRSGREELEGARTSEASAKECSSAAEAGCVGGDTSEAKEVIFCGGSGLRRSGVGLGTSEASAKEVLFCGRSGQNLGLEGARAKRVRRRRRYCCRCSSARQKRADSRAVGGRPPEPPPRPARLHTRSVAHALGRTCARPHMCSAAHVLGRTCPLKPYC